MENLVLLKKLKEQYQGVIKTLNELKATGPSASLTQETYEREVEYLNLRIDDVVVEILELIPQLPEPRQTLWNRLFKDA